MVKKRKIMHIFLCIPMLLCSLLFTDQALAAENGCTVNIPVYVETKNITEEKNIQYKVTITAETEGIPMPVQNSLLVHEGSCAEFGPITYSVPGDYKYRITQKAGKEEYYKYDTSIYRVTVRIVNAQDGNLKAEIWAQKDGGKEKKEEIRFTNEYIPKLTATPKITAAETRKPAVMPKAGKKSVSPKTDDESPLVPLRIILVLAAMTTLFAGRKIFGNRSR